MVAIRGKGKEHAKWSPVSTAFYRLLPSVEIKGSIKKELAEELKKTCPMGVFDIEGGKAVVANERSCTACRECIREEKFRENVVLGKRDKHFEC